MAPRKSVHLPLWQSIVRVLGSLSIAVPLLIIIAGVLAYGTIYETRFGTASVQRFIYTAWWFQALLAFLAVNLAAAALERWPWKKPHTPFLLAHLGIICILLGGIIGGRWGIDGQLIIPEGQAERTLQLNQNVLVFRAAAPGLEVVVPTNFETQAWVREPNLTVQVPLEGRFAQVTVDRYFPNAQLTEDVAQDGTEDNPAVQFAISHETHREEFWLLARDPERAGTRWQEAHVLFKELASDAEADRWLGRTKTITGRGTLALTFTGLGLSRDIPVPANLTKPIRIEDTPYTLTFKELFTDLAITEEGVVNRSNEPNNPAVAFTLSGPEGADGHLAFALHPDFSSMHGRRHAIPVQTVYLHPAAEAVLPPDTFALLRLPSGELTWALTDEAGARTIAPAAVGTPVRHAGLGYEVTPLRIAPRARLVQEFANRSDEIRAEAVHLSAHDGERTDETWLWLRGAAELTLGDARVHVEYQPATRQLPFVVKLIDFRKMDYPGTSMPASFEADVEMTDAQRGIILIRKISMNNPLKYRGYSLFQSSFIPGAVETTVLSVRNDPGTPLVYAGFLIVVAGVVWMFVTRPVRPPKQQGAR